MSRLLVATDGQVAAVYAAPDALADAALAAPVRVSFGDGLVDVGALLDYEGAYAVRTYAAPGTYDVVATGRLTDGTVWQETTTVTVPSTTTAVPLDAVALADTLPPDGPATFAAARRRYPGADADDLAALVAAVNAQVRTWPTAQRSRGQLAWWPPTVAGADMLVRRLWRRRDTPAGVEVMGDAFAYVARLDPDVAQLLELGDWATPGVG